MSEVRGQDGTDAEDSPLPHFEQFCEFTFGKNQAKIIIAIVEIHSKN